jgi:hypothetical protein
MAIRRPLIQPDGRSRQPPPRRPTVPPAGKVLFLARLQSVRSARAAGLVGQDRSQEGRPGTGSGSRRRGVAEAKGVLMMKRSENSNDIDSARVEVSDYHRGERENTMFRWLFYEFAFLGYTILGYVVCIVCERVSSVVR